MSELSLIVKATAILTVSLMAAALARRARASVRHAILASAFLAILLLPVVMYVIPQVAIELPIAAAPTAALLAPGMSTAIGSPETPRGDAAVGNPAPARERIPAWPGVVRGVWAVGTIAFLLSLSVSLWQFRRLRRHGLPWTAAAPLISELASAADVRRRVDVLLHEDLAAPAVSGWRQATVLLPSDASTWPTDEIRHAMVHELEHIRRSDWVVHLVARAACALYWFHPLAWLAFGRLALEAERACDDAVLQAAENADYAEQLVQLARRMSAGPEQPLLAMAKRSDLATRVSAILDLTQSRGRLGAVRIGTALAGAAVMLLAIAPLRAVGAAPKAAQPAAAQTANPTRPSLQVLRSSTLDRALLEAADEGNLDVMSSLIGSGANVNGAVPGDGSPLIAAARRGRLESVRFLLDRGAEPNLGVPGDGNALIRAAQAGQIAVVDFLLTRGASIDLVVEGDENALITASAAGRLEVVKLLVTRGADINVRVWVNEVWRAPGVAARDGEWRTPLNMARRGGHDDVVKYLRSAGAQE